MYKTIKQHLHINQIDLNIMELKKSLLKWHIRVLDLKSVTPVCTVYVFVCLLCVQYV